MSWCLWNAPVSRGSLLPWSDCTDIMVSWSFEDPATVLSSCRWEQVHRSEKSRVGDRNVASIIPSNPLTFFFFPFCLHKLVLKGERILLKEHSHGSMWLEPVGGGMWKFATSHSSCQWNHRERRRIILMTWVIDPGFREEIVLLKHNESEKDQY